MISNIFLTNPSYVYNRQHVQNKGKETIGNSVINEDVFLKNPNFIIQIDPNIQIMKPVKHDLEISIDNVIYTTVELLEQKFMVSPTLESKKEYAATINQVFEQDNSYLFDITYDERKENILKYIDYISVLLKKIQWIEFEEKKLE